LHAEKVREKSVERQDCVSDVDSQHIDMCCTVAAALVEHAIWKQRRMCV